MQPGVRDLTGIMLLQEKEMVMRISSPRGTAGTVGKIYSRNPRSTTRAALGAIAATGIPLLLLIGLRQFLFG